MAISREDFKQFVEKTLEEVISLAEQKCGCKLPRTYAFCWVGRSQPIVRTEVAEYIAQRIFVDDEHIFPCVDLGVADLMEDGSPLIVASVAGYSPRSFGPNWTGRMGPFVHVVGQPLLNRLSGHPSTWSPDGAVFAYSIPDLRKRN